MRPVSMAFTHQAPQTDIARDTLPELLPVFSFMNSQSNKLYQEGYFLKLNDLDTRMFLHPIIVLRVFFLCRC
jgi:CCR4-NOT transcriptional complex subunit CAF120